MGTEGAVFEDNAIKVTPPVMTSTDWRNHMTDDLKADPVVSGWAEKASEKDIPALVKAHAHLYKRMGSAVNLPGKDAKPEDVTAFKARLIEAGMLPAPITDPKDYAIAKPATLPDGVQWSDELGGKLAATLHKYQVPKEAVADLLALQMEAMGGVGQSVTIDREKALTALKAEHGEKYEERAEMVSRMIPGLFSPETLDFFDQTGLGNDPKFMSALLRLAPLAMQDSSFIESIPQKGGEITGESAREEYTKIISDPTHPHYDGLRRRDPKSEAYVNALYGKAYGNEKKPLEQLAAL